MHHRGRDQPCERKCDVGRPAADRAGRGEIEPRGEDCKPREERSFGGGQQVVAPRQRRRQAAVAWVGCAGRGLQQREAVVEPVGELSEWECRGARRGQLNRERQAIKAAAHLSNQRGVACGDREARVGGRCPVGEQARRVALRGALPALVRRGCRQGANGVDAFAGNSERLAAGREHTQLGRPGQQDLDELGAGGDEVLAVVEHDDSRTGRQRRRDGAGERVTGLGADAEGIGQRLRDQRRRRQRCELHEIGVDVVQPARHLQREAGLPRPARPVNVTSRCDRTRAGSSSSSPSRPMNEPSGAGRVAPLVRAGCSR